MPMQPLSPITRRLYLLLFVTLFCAIIPIVILYADGWRYTRGYGFVRTGGIFISVPYPNATVSISGSEVGTSGFLQHSFYKGDLAPSAYIVHVEREGFQAWDRLLVVEEQLVTDARVVLIPKEIVVLKILSSATSTANTSTTTRTVSRSVYNSYLAIFAATSSASTTIPIDESNGVGLFLAKGKLVVRWIEENAFPPSHFCERPSVCVIEITPDKSAQVTNARFFRGGIVYVTKEGIVYFAEPDVRQTPVKAELFRVKNADIRIIADTFFVKSGNTLYEITL